MIASIHQPAYLPWLGYLDRIAASDVFVFLDIVQFEKNSFTNRNRIKTATGPLWLTVPVLQQGHTARTLLDMEIDPRQEWRRKHLRSIEMSYRRAAYFEACFGQLSQLLTQPETMVSELCWRQLKFWLTEFGITTTVVRASDLQVSGDKSDLVLALCRAVGADEYLSGPLGRGYLKEEDFTSAGISVRYHEYRHPRYRQLHGDFLPNLSALDCWFNCGPEAARHLEGKR